MDGKASDFSFSDGILDLADMFDGLDDEDYTEEYVDKLRQEAEDYEEYLKTGVRKQVEEEAGEELEGDLEEEAGEELEGDLEEEAEEELEGDLEDETEEELEGDLEEEAEEEDGLAGFSDLEDLLNDRLESMDSADNSLGEVFVAGPDIDEDLGDELEGDLEDEIGEELESDLEGEIEEELESDFVDETESSEVKHEFLNAEVSANLDADLTTDDILDDDELTQMFSQQFKGGMSLGSAIKTGFVKQLKDNESADEVIKDDSTNVSKDTQLNPWNMFGFKDEEAKSDTDKEVKEEQNKIDKKSQTEVEQEQSQDEIKQNVVNDDVLSDLQNILLDMQDDLGIVSTNKSDVKEEAEVKKEESVESNIVDKKDLKIEDSSKNECSQKVDNREELIRLIVKYSNKANIEPDIDEDDDLETLGLKLNLAKLSYKKYLKKQQQKMKKETNINKPSPKNSMPKSKNTTVKEISEQDDIQKYTEMTLDNLFKVVKQYLLEKGVTKQLVPVEDVISKFGKNNIKRLRDTNYIIILRNGISLG